MMVLSAAYETCCLVSLLARGLRRIVRDKRRTTGVLVVRSLVRVLRNSVGVRLVVGVDLAVFVAHWGARRKRGIDLVLVMVVMMMGMLIFGRRVLVDRLSVGLWLVVDLMLLLMVDWLFVRRPLNRR